MRHGAPAAKPLGAEGLGAPEAVGAFDAPASAEADGELPKVGLALESLGEGALNGAHPPTVSARATTTAPTRLVIKAKHYIEKRVVAEREGFEPSMGLPPNRISNWTQKRDQRDS